MFQALARFATARWHLVLLATLILSIVGVQAFRSLPIEAFPDVTDPMVEVVGLYPGQSAEEVEKRVTVELERVLAGTPNLIDLRSVSVFGLSLVTLTFAEGTTDFQLRTHVAERLRDATLPDTASTIMGPQATPVGQIYRYTLRGNRSLRDLRSINDFVVERRLRAVQGVADVWTFGGFQRQYQARVDPTRLAAAGVSLQEVHEALSRANSNAGGGYVAAGDQEFVVRGLGAVRLPSDIGLAVVKEVDGVPIRVRDVADIVEGSTPRRGSVGRGHEDEVVEGIVMLRRGENPSVVLDALRERITQLNAEVLPKDVRIDTFYDRTNLVDATLSTVSKNMLEGALLVVFILYLFLRSARGVLVIATVIPLSLLSAFIGLRLLGLPANLISLGAIDFGILVDGAVIVVEATLHALSAKDAIADGKRGTIEKVAHTVARPVGFAMILIITALLPIFSLQRTEGRIFAPMAYTYAFALLGALICATMVVPALEELLLPEKVKHVESRWLDWLRARYQSIVGIVYRRRVFAFVIAPLVLAIGGFYARGIGNEFLPELNEGGFYITATFPSTISLDQTKIHTHEIRERILQLPEAVDVLSHIGRPEAATQAEGSFNAEFFVPLTQESQWRPGMTRHEIEAELRTTLSEIPGVQFNFSQPITDRVFETISGIIGQVVVKVHGEDLEQMTRLAEVVVQRLGPVRGVADLALYQAGDIPQLQVEVDREAIARRGLAIEDVQRTVQVALGSEPATEVWEGERRYGVAIKLPDSLRGSPDELAGLLVGAADRKITLGEVSKIRQTTGRTSIWREDFSRFVAVKFNVRGRDLGGTVEDAKRALAGMQAPEGTYVTWSGEFQNQARAMRRLSFALPIALVAIFGILYLNFRRLSPVLVIMATLPFGVIGSVAGLRLMGENFSVSSAVGCIALLGQLVLAGIVLCTRIDEHHAAGAPDTLAGGVGIAFRPVMLTSSIALFGLVPAALSHAMGSETQRPFAIAIIAGLVAGVPAVLFLLPGAYFSLLQRFARR
ncbi:MAG: efflux RND transporter permease subunit [Deltaproteobacteria bacterium]|nr:efflux RND transporter permease subunit [Deltaproteobacteria bacterium]